ncbi:MAG: 4Fe-4S dicluster domain-containing protein [Desulfobacteraceae bacterium]|nr:MAG: 4Fe-4S dicluster domain-containing protein [Desulfobacteraceae bacterium]
MDSKTGYRIDGREDGVRIESRILEEKIQAAIEQGERFVEINAFGQHGIGGRLWKAGDESVHVKITGQAGQRAGSLGFPNTVVEIMGPGSDDVGWLNAGATIVVHGNAGNGLANAMAQGKIYVAGNIGARGMTMTKSNPRFAPPEIWVLGSVGDYFGEFMAGGIAVVCGMNPQTPRNILGYRPLVGMVGGRVYFRGPHKGYSETDAKQVPISDDDWRWFSENLKEYLTRIHREDVLSSLLKREDWQLLTARSPSEKAGVAKRSMASFRAEVWNKELGSGGLIGDLTNLDRSPISLITTGELRRFVPVWENGKYKAPCEGTCPTGIPVHERWRLVREGRIDEAVDLALEYTPFPATICGYLCPNPCMQACTRQILSMMPIDVTKLGKASINAGTPEFPEQSGKKIAVIGGGPAGLSIAWQLRRNGHEAVIYDMEPSIGGKITSVIPESRIPKEVLTAELARISSVIPHIHLKQKLGKHETERLKGDYDFLVVAAGAQKPRILPVPGKERMIPAMDFLARAKNNSIQPGRKVVIIGAGNVGCDVATEAGRLGAESITLIDVQEPASFGKEREEAEAYGAVFKWPCFTKEVTEKGVLLTTGEMLEADTVVISIGDVPDTDFLPESVETDRGFVKVDAFYRTSDSRIFAIGDIVRPGLLTDAIGAGRKAAETINQLLEGREPIAENRMIIDTDRISLEYFDPRITGFDDVDQCGAQCSSCGNCRDCGICISICPKAAISRKDLGNGAYEYIVDDSRCIGCGFCAGACPCGIWFLTENEPMG